MSHVIHFFHRLWAQWLYAPLALLLLILAATGVVIFTPILGRHRAYQTFAVNWALLTTKLLPIHVEAEGVWPQGWLRSEAPRESGTKPVSYVLAANHQSQFDIPVLLSQLRFDLFWVMKKEVMKIPIIGIAAKALGCIPIDRNNGELARRHIAAAVDQMSGDIGLMFFAEGTRSKDVPLLPYKTGAFRIAIEQQMPLLPIAIIGTRDINPPGTFWIRPGRVKVIAGPAIETTGMTQADAGELTQRVQQWTLEQIALAAAKE